MYSFFFLLALALYKKTRPWSMNEIVSIKDQSEHSFITSQTDILDFSFATKYGSPILFQYVLTYLVIVPPT